MRSNSPSDCWAGVSGQEAAQESGPVFTFVHRKAVSGQKFFTSYIRAVPQLAYSNLVQHSQLLHKFSFSRKHVSILLNNYNTIIIMISTFVFIKNNENTYLLQEDVSLPPRVERAI